MKMLILRKLKSKNIKENGAKSVVVNQELFDYYFELIFMMDDLRNIEDDYKKY